MEAPTVPTLSEVGPIVIGHGVFPECRIMIRPTGLISGIPYQWEPLDYTSGETNMQRLDRAPKGGQTMIIDVSRDDNGDYDFTVTIDGHTKTYHVTGGAGDPDSWLYIQSHWGSGVKFTSANVKKL